LVTSPVVDNFSPSQVFSIIAEFENVKWLVVVFSYNAPKILVAGVATNLETNY